MKVSAETRKYHESRVRSVMVLQQDASSYEIQRILEKSEQPLTLDVRYVHKIRNKIHAERAHRNDHLTVSARIAFIQDKKQLIDSQLWRLITAPATSDRAKVAALGLLMKHEIDLLQSEMDAGVFERHIGKVSVERPAFEIEHRKAVLEALKLWGIMKPKDQTPNSIVNSIVNNAPEPKQLEGAH